MTLLGEMFPADPMMIGAMLAPLGLAAGPVVPCREWRELYAALDCGVVAAIHPFYTAAIREFEAAGRPIVGSAPVGHDGTAAWLAAIGDAFGVAADKIAAAQNAFLPAIKGALAATPIKGTITLSGYEGSELLVARLLIESGADVPYVGTACPKTPWSEPDREWLEAQGVKVKFRASLEDDLRRDGGDQARSGHRHHAGGAEGQGAGHPVALLHQPDFRASADGSGGCRIAGAGRQCRHGQQGPDGHDERLLRRCRRRRHRRHLGRRAEPAPRLPRAHQKKLDKQARAAKAAEADDLMLSPGS